MKNSIKATDGIDLFDSIPEPFDSTKEFDIFIVDVQRELDRKKFEKILKSNDIDEEVDPLSYMKHLNHLEWNKNRKKR